MSLVHLDVSCSIFRDGKYVSVVEKILENGGLFVWRGSWYLKVVL